MSELQESNAIPSPIPPVEQAVSLMIGSITIAWNSTHEQVFRLFHRASGMSKEMAEAVFFSLRSDASQRDITRAVCSRTTLMGEEWKKCVESTLKLIGTKFGERNAFIHTMWDREALFSGFVVPSTGISPDLHHKMLGKDIIPQLQKLLVETMKLNAYIELNLKQWSDAQASLQKQSAQSPVSCVDNSDSPPPAPSGGT